MKRLLHCGIFLAVLTASGWSYADPLDIHELCGDFEILKDPENRIYRGQYKGGGVTNEHVLVITPITGMGTENRQTLTFYVWGKQPRWDISEAGCIPATGMVKGDILTIYWKSDRVTYKFSGDKASVKYKWSGGTTKGKLTLSDS